MSESKSAVSLDVAISEVQKWLDHKRIRPAKRESLKIHIENLQNAIAEGDLVLNEDYTLTQKLLFPVGETSIDKLDYSPRITFSQVEPYLKTSGDGGDGRLNATICALTKKPLGIIKAMDNEDRSLATDICIFFI